MARVVIQISNGEIQRVLAEEPSCGVVVEEVFPIFPDDEYPLVKFQFFSATYEPDEVQARFVEMALQRRNEEQEVEA